MRRFTVILGFIICATLAASASADTGYIQSLIDAAHDGDTIIVPPGTYYETVALDGKRITLRSQNPDDPAVVAATIIDGGSQNQGICCADGESTDTVISGFTIQNCAEAILCSYASPTISKNVIINSGGGTDGVVIDLDQSAAVLLNNRIVGNQGFVIECDNASNEANEPVIIAENVISGNAGDVLLNAFASRVMLEGNIITGNSGGGGWTYYGAIYATSNVIVGNEYGLLYDEGSFGDVTGNIICDNSKGGVIEGYGEADVTGNIICGNRRKFGGAAVDTEGYADIGAQNNLIIGNVSGGDGGAYYISPFDESSFIESANDTICGNSAAGVGGGCCGECQITNDIVAGNIASSASEIATDVTSTANIAYSLIDGGRSSTSGNISWGVGNISADPLFAQPILGTWTTPPAFGIDLYQTTLKDGAAAWGINSLKGKFLNPDTSQYLQFYIVSNTTDTVTVWGDVSSIADAGGHYAISDYHLQSAAGRWDTGANGGTGDWVTDADTSPCIDTGDPTADFSNEPAPNGGRINMGAEGDTAYASKSPALTITATSLPKGHFGAPYTAVVTAAGGKPPLTYDISEGALPAGLTMSSSGVITGAPATDGTCDFTIRVHDSGVPSQSASMRIGKK